MRLRFRRRNARWHFRRLAPGKFPSTRALSAARARDVEIPNGMTIVAPHQGDHEVRQHESAP